MTEIMAPSRGLRAERGGFSSSAESGVGVFFRERVDSIGMGPGTGETVRVEGSIGEKGGILVRWGQRPLVLEGDEEVVWSAGSAAPSVGK